MKRPKLTACVARGLLAIYPFVLTEIEAGDDGYLQDQPGRVRADANKALTYIGDLINWYEAKAVATCDVCGHTWKREESDLCPLILSAAHGASNSE